MNLANLCQPDPNSLQFFWDKDAVNHESVWTRDAIYIKEGNQNLRLDFSRPIRLTLNGFFEVQIAEDTTHTYTHTYLTRDDVAWFAQVVGNIRIDISGATFTLVENRK